MKRLILLFLLMLGGTLTQAQKQFYNDGKLFLYYEENGIRVAIHLEITRTYGKYYQAFIVVENLDKQNFLFNPEDIKAIIKKEDKTSELYALSSYEYMKKVHHQNNWAAVAYVFGAACNTAQAGYSSSRTYTSIYGTYGSSYGYSNTYSYDGASRYYAQQIANQNISMFTNSLHNISQILQNGYLRKNTITRGKAVSGYVNIKYKKADNILIIIPVNGKEYKFHYAG